MGKRITVNAKITEEESKKLNWIAERENISVTAIVRLLVDYLLNGDIELDRGEIKPCTVTDEIAEEDFSENLKYKELRFDRLLSAFERQGYPEFVIRQSIEQMIIQVNDTKYSPKRARFEDGC